MPISSSIWHTFLKLVDGPMRRQVAIRWTNRKTAGAVWACATQIEMHRSQDDSDSDSGVDVIPRSRDPSQIDPKRIF